MQTLILSLHVIVCVALVVLVLLQSGKEGMGVIFGGGNASVFGSSGAGGLLAKVTAFMAVLFVITCLGFNLLSSTSREQESTILDVRLEDAPKPAAAPVSEPAAKPEGSTSVNQTAPQTSAPAQETPAQPDNAQEATPAGQPASEK